MKNYSKKEKKIQDLSWITEVGKKDNYVSLLISWDLRQ